MPGNGKVFVSHEYADNALCVPLIAALDAWEIDYWFDPRPQGDQPQLPPAVQAAIAERDVFIRVCTPAAQRSLRMTVEASAFRALQAEERRQRKSRRTYINLLLDPGYVPEPFDNATLFIDGVSRARPLWIADLGRALGMGPAARVLNRRAFVGLGAAVALTLASAATTGVVLLNQQPATSRPSLDLRRTPGQVRWQAETNTYGDSGLAVAGGVVYAVGDKSHGILAYRAADGQKLWSNTQVYNNNFGVAPAVAGQTLYVAASTGDLYALDTKTGKRVWRVSVGQDNPATPVVSGDTVYLATDDSTLYALAAKDGKTRWHTPLLVSNGLQAAVSNPVVANGLVYTGSADHTFYAFDAKSGAVKWKFLTRGPIFYSPAVADGLVYVGSMDGSVYALDALSGKPRWRFQTGGGISSSLAVVGGVVYAGSLDVYLYALDARTGALYWRALAGTQDNTGFITGHEVNGLPAVSFSAESVYAAAGGFLNPFYVKDGSRRWRYKTGSDLATSSPVVADDLGLVYVGAADKNLYALNL